MGHERVGILPRRKPWTQVVRLIADYPDSGQINSLAQKTIQNVRLQFESIEKDSGVRSAYKFLVLLSYAYKTNSPIEFLSGFGIDLPGNFSQLKLAKALNEWTSKNQQSIEYGTVAKQAAIDALSQWYSQHQSNQLNLFTAESESSEVWNQASNGAGFCELSRLYFSNFTERYMKYFLEREASANLNSISERNHFAEQLEKHIDSVSNHAFETSKITQSYSAGWFTKHTKDSFPSDAKIKKFVSFSFKKMKDELLREERK